MSTNAAPTELHAPGNRPKAVSTVRAQLALAGGFVLHELGDGVFLITRWNLTRHCENLAAVIAFLQRLGVYVDPLPAREMNDAPAVAAARGIEGHEGIEQPDSAKAYAATHLAVQVGGTS